MTSTAGIFTLKEPIGIEMKRISVIMKVDPERGSRIYSIGDSLVSCANNGMLSRFKRLLNEVNPDDLLMYYVAKAFEASLLKGHLMIANYLLDNGYPLNNESLPLCLHSCLSSLEDSLCVVVIEFLASKQIDINQQAPKTWLTPLHVAVQKQLYHSTKLLISLGSDVNAVAEGDLMPLTIAYNNNKNNQSDTNRLIIEMLLEQGAKETWRKNQTVFVQINNCTESTSVSVGIDNNNDKKYVKFTGGGSIINNNDDDHNKNNENTTAVSSTLSKLTISDHEIINETDANHFKMSDDGAMLFSTL